MRKFGKRKKIHHGDPEDGDTENRRKCKGDKGLRQMKQLHGESSGEPTGGERSGSPRIVKQNARLAATP